MFTSDLPTIRDSWGHFDRKGVPAA